MKCAVFAGEPLDSRSAAGPPRGYWSFSWVAEDDLMVMFPNSTVSKSGKWFVVRHFQTDRQAEVPPSSTESLFPIGLDTWHQLSISAHERLGPACLRSSALAPSQCSLCADEAVRDPLKDPDKSNLLLLLIHTHHTQSSVIKWVLSGGKAIQFS